MNKFTELPLSNAMLSNLDSLKYNSMTPIQKESIPYILKGRDVLAQGKTGSGKTAAFGIGLLHNLDFSKYRIQGLVLCPTRELAEQVTNELRRLAKFRHNIKLLKITGGMPIYKQEHSLSHEAHIIVGTPGRVQKLLDRGSLNLDDLMMVVLDEADRMLDMGFIDQIKDIFDFTPSTIQTLCFSATFPKGIKDLSQGILQNPKEITVESNHDQKVIHQTFFSTQGENKTDLVIDILRKEQLESVIVFCNTKDSCRRVGAELKKSGLHSLALHGDLEQKERTEVLIRFSNGSSRVLVATDVAARGLDIKELAGVINYELPFETETYIHRIGRTGRAGLEGLSFSLVNPKESFRLDDINKYLKTDYEVDNFVNTDIDKKKKFLEPDMVTLSINGGRRNKVSPGDLLGALTSEGGIKGDDVGKIDRLDYITFVAVKRDVATIGFDKLDNGEIKGRYFRAISHD